MAELKELYEKLSGAEDHKTKMVKRKYINKDGEAKIFEYPMTIKIKAYTKKDISCLRKLLRKAILESDEKKLIELAGLIV